MQEINIDDFQNIITCDNENIKQTNFSFLLEDKNTNNTLLLAKDISTEEVFEFVTRPLYHVFAAGGVVENERGEILFIFRNGYWDLPKGHWEEGESFEQTAKREVQEETGIKQLSIKGFLDISFHIYYMHGRQEIKHTYWYKMQSSSLEKLWPQTQEGISDLIWERKDNLTEILNNTYPNIKLLMEKISKEK
ncbi:MAG: NUDIX domain-containing protein [Bacteroidota bacterium]|nr:NUDIX domain-containing protein [Bacteroidota bacterium]